MLQFQNKVKKVKFSNVGMADLINVVALLKQEFKQIRNAQSVPNAKTWIESNYYVNILDAVEEDLDCDDYKGIVINSKIDHKIVNVKEYTTTASSFPYQNYYYIIINI